MIIQWGKILVENRNRCFGPVPTYSTESDKHKTEDSMQKMQEERKHGAEGDERRAVSDHQAALPHILFSNKTCATLACEQVVVYV
jgi:hypothetical protein